MAYSSLRLHLKDEFATDALARELAAPFQTRPDDSIQPAAGGQHADRGPVLTGGTVHLKGNLGAGKTAFCRAFLRACGVTGRIKSPSYALLETYKVSNLYCYHLDFYRFNDPREWLDAGFRDLLRDDALVLIEWPEKAQGLLPPPDLLVRLDYANDGRDVEITPFTDRGQSWLNPIVPPGMPPPAP